jgi:hypothetical protein
MKRLVAAAFIVASSALTPAVFADPRGVAVDVPANTSDPAALAAYTQQLAKAVDRVCRRQAVSVIGHGYEVYRVCVRETQDSVARQDPTGSFAGLANDGRFDVAAR